jgi:hypothetical protein
MSTVDVGRPFHTLVDQNGIRLTITRSGDNENGFQPVMIDHEPIVALLSAC